MIGTGNAATILGRIITHAGHTIMQVAGRNVTQTTTLANEFKGEAINDLKNITSTAELYIISVSDSAVEQVAAQLPALNAPVVHTTGSLSKNVLANIFTTYGVMYPLQSLRKEMKVLPVVPIFVDGNNPQTTTYIRNFATTISSQVDEANDEQRLKLHIAAVISSNFTNYLYSLAERFCQRENINFQHLLPLIQETANRLQNHSPLTMQTGPAARGDINTINNHLQLLQQQPEIQTIYRLLSEHIMQLHQH